MPLQRGQFLGYKQVGDPVMITSQPMESFSGFTKGNFNSTLSTIIVQDSIMAWWDTNSGITLNGSTVSQWVDKVGGYVLAQPTAVKQPTFIVNDVLYNNHNSVNFTVSTQNLVVTSTLPGSFPTIGTNSGMSILLVYHLPGGQNCSPMAGGTAVLNTGWWYMQNYSNVAHAQYEDTSTHDAPLSLLLPVTAVASINIDRGLGILTNTVNGFNNTTAIDTALTNFSTISSSAGFNGYIAGLPTILEAVIYSRSLTTAEINQNANAMRLKYGF